MKNKYLLLIGFGLILTIAIKAQDTVTSFVGKVSIYPTGITPDNTYNGNLVITKPSTSGQYLNLIRQGGHRWSIGTVYDSNNFAIGQGSTNDASFTSPYFSINDVGKIGIGTTSPIAKLNVAKGTILSTWDGNLGGGIYNMFVGSFDGLALTSSNREFRIEQRYLEGSLSTGLLFNGHSTGTTGENFKYYQGTYNILGGIIFGENGGTKFITSPAVSVETEVSPITAMFISGEGKIGIGTTQPDDLLTVNGTIHAKELNIDLNGPLADFVFHEKYKLRSLFEVAQFLKTNNHLPDMPSAAEIKKNGVNVGDMQNKLLQKIEELTLYAIEQQKRIEALEKALKQ